MTGQYLAAEPLSAEVNDLTVSELLERLTQDSLTETISAYSTGEVGRSQSLGAVQILDGQVHVGQITCISRLLPPFNEITPMLKGLSIN